VAALDGADVACGGVRQLAPGIGEVKRMYVVPSARGRGLSRLLLRALVEHAVAVGLGELWLETGTAQPEAMALYESEGFEPIAPYGQYRDEPDSRCYRLVLPSVGAAAASQPSR
jgi:GNAT superfamily N-acetyltransferase